MSAHDPEPVFQDLDDRIGIALRVLRLEDPQRFVRDFTDQGKYNPSLLTAYIRCFVRLAYLGDVSLVAEELGTTRQTVARQLGEFENLIGCHLFRNFGKSSKLTDRGALWLPRAQEILEVSQVFLIGNGNSPLDYRSVQLPLRMLIHDDDAPALLKLAVSRWMTSSKRLDCPVFSEVSDHWIVYDRHMGVWKSRSIGERSAYADFFGAEAVQESEGLTVPKMVGGLDLRDELSLVLDGVLARGGIHYSEVACRLTLEGERTDVRYQRILMELVDAREAPVVASIIEVQGHSQ